MKWSPEKIDQMIKELESMKVSLEKDFKQLTEACEKLVEETKEIPSLDEQLKNILKIQGEKFNE